MSPSSDAKHFVCLAGPTASGKSACALALAKVVPIEIISVDSALIYRHMDVGTAKPTASEQAAVPHHLIDLIEPTDSYSAAQFAVDVAALIPAIHARGRLPVLVGGTMLYFKAWLHGLDPLPGSDAAVRTQLDREAAALGWPEMHRQLMLVDPQTAARLAPTDAQRIQRALEVFRSSGRPLSSLHTGALTRRDPLGPDCLAFISLEPQERRVLHERIACRFDAMLTAGLVDEVRGLRQRGDLTPNLPSMRCVGYRQTWQALDKARDGQLSATQQATLREQGIAATRQLAKRQLTWLRSLPGRHTVPMESDRAFEHVIECVQDRLRGMGTPRRPI